MNKVHKMMIAKSLHRWLGARHFSTSTIPPRKSSLPIRELAWNKASFYDKKELEEETRRVFDVCHGCRLCFNLCDSFPRLFDLIDKSKTGELNSVPATNFKGVVDACTLCDMCYIAKCPYTPPHPFNIDFPHLMLRYKIVENSENNPKPTQLIQETTNDPKNENGTHLQQQKHQQPQHNNAAHEVIKVQEGVSRELILKSPSSFRQLMTNMDLISPLSSTFSPITNWFLRNRIFRNILERVAGVHPKAHLPVFVPAQSTFMKQSRDTISKPNEKAPGYGNKVVLYSTCIVNWNKPNVGLAARSVLTHNGVEVVPVFPQCCGMPQLEQGKADHVIKRALKISEELVKHIDKGYTVVSLTPSCTLMMKQEWPALLPQNENIQKLSQNTYDISEYIVTLNKTVGLMKDLNPLNLVIDNENQNEEKDKKEIGVALHNACHSRAQNVGFKSLEMLKLIPNVQILTLDRCSGHGGSWGAMKQNYETALNVGKPVFTRIIKETLKLKENNGKMILASECPLAGTHIKDGVENLDNSINDHLTESLHPIEVLALSYGLKKM